MEERNIKISFQIAKEWYKGDDKVLKKFALQAFSEEELTHKSFYDIKTVEDALQYLRNNNMCEDLISEYRATQYNSYSEKICEYRIIVAALTNNEERKLKTGECWFPVVQFCEIGKEKDCWGNKKVGTILHDGNVYTVMSGGVTNHSAAKGIGIFNSNDGMSYSWMSVGFRSVSSKKIAQYISEQFGRLLFEVHYGGINCDWKWVD